MHNPFEAGVPIYIGICAVIFSVCSFALLIGLAVFFHLEWLFLLVPIIAGARAGYFIFRGR